MPVPLFAFSFALIIAFSTSLVGKALADSLLTHRIALLGSFVGLVRSFNPGVAFGITFPGDLQNVIVPVALGVMLIVALVTSKTLLTAGGFGLIIGGAIANLLDRIPDGAVTDFFQVGTFPIFNVADSWITIGVGLLLLDMFLQWKANLL